MSTAKKTGHPPSPVTPVTPGWDAWDVPTIRMPIGAGTPEGLRAWRASAAFPRWLKAEWLGDRIVLEIRDAPDAPILEIPARATTPEGFRDWATSEEFPERGRISFLDSEIFIDMSREEIETHNKVKAEISRALGNLNKELDLGEFFTDGVLVTHDGFPDLSHVPDAAFVSWPSYEAARVRLIPRKDWPGHFMELRGSPDCVVEIVSRYSVQKDTTLLRSLYRQAGIPEYWLVDARYEEDEVLFQILRRRGDRYVAAPARDGWRRSDVSGRGFRLERRRNRQGRWSYTLQVMTP
jgi:Uma2 family endonuclease